MNFTYPTPYPDVNAMLQTLLPHVQSVLENHFVGMYLDGSLAVGDFDEDSDIDFVVVTDQPISEADFLALQAMHDRIATIDSPYATDLEGSYLSQHALRHYNPADDLHPNIERGAGERLKWVYHEASWDVHRSVLRDRGVIIAGPAPETLIDPVSPDQLRAAMLSAQLPWAARLLDQPAQIERRGYQSYIVLTLCRLLYTLHHGAIVSKLAATRWAKETLGEEWVPLIERAWEGRHHPDQEASAEDVEATRALIRYALVRDGSQG